MCCTPRTFVPRSSCSCMYYSGVVSMYSYSGVFPTPVLLYMYSYSTIYGVLRSGRQDTHNVLGVHPEGCTPVGEELVSRGSFLSVNVSLGSLTYGTFTWDSTCTPNTIGTIIQLLYEDFQIISHFSNNVSLCCNNLYKLLRTCVTPFQYICTVLNSTSTMAMNSLMMAQLMKVRVDTWDRSVSIGDRWSQTPGRTHCMYW